MTSIETKSAFTYRLAQYESAVVAWEKDPDDLEKLSMLLWAHNDLERIRRVTGDLEQTRAFPTDAYDHVRQIEPSLLRYLPSAALASAIGWDRTLLRLYAGGRPNPVAIFEEGNRVAQTQVVVYFGDNRFVTHGSMRDAIETINNYWENDPNEDVLDCAWYGPGHGVRVVRENIRRVYGRGEGDRGGMRNVWDWLDGSM
ncbi:hypothetical protein GYMLUDRAFT_253548 [Collybiopsis luxurians FD-317 M1]|uniref:Uncharacterized protein n=1 Tax=Collybiopsis luxurians FD-317 M1 TaxID=944289 RepID=A0A0D0B6U6_9AGAR|nr:hypothetical protein GYMLUDRAFT_253548 [Collybiopsis luxurians FD-317 M1]